jgi:ribonuclease HI
MPDFRCETCGTPFSLSDTVLAKYPGWTPRQCRGCKGGTAAKRPGKAGGGRRATTLVEENLPLAEVLAKYADGPSDGVFTDGSANPNPGPGGWGAVYVVGGEVVEHAHGAEDHTTNNRMELTALLHGFDLVPAGTSAAVYTDSKLCVDTLTKWAPSWQRNGWKRKAGPVQNLDLVQAAFAKYQARRDELDLQWIAAHSGARWNEYADSLSTAYLRDEL